MSALLPLGLLALLYFARKKDDKVMPAAPLPAPPSLPPVDVVRDETPAPGPEPESVPAVEVQPSPAVQQAQQGPGMPVEEALREPEQEQPVEAPGRESAPEPVPADGAVQQAAEQPGTPVDEVSVQPGGDPVRAARDLAAYAREWLAQGKGAMLGTRGAPSPAVRALQAQMGGIEADGIYGPETRARGKALGVAMPARR